MKDSRPPSVSRRGLFAGAGAVGALAVAAGVVPGGREAVPPAVAKPPDDGEQGRYQLTQHVLQYYRTTKV